MSLPYFPMFPTDFEAKTSHLTLAEDGAYNRLLRLMWMTPGCSLPADDKWIRRRMRVDQATYDDVVKVVIDEFFRVEKGRLVNAKLGQIFAEANDSYKKKAAAGSKGGKAKALKTKETDSSRASRLLKQPEPEPKPETTTVNDDAEKQGGLVHRERLLRAMGADPVSGMHGPNGRMIGTPSDMIEAEKWTAAGLTEAEQVAEVQRIMAGRDSPPNTFRYFSQPMADLAKAKTSPLPQGIASNAKPNERAAKLSRWAKIA